MTRALPDDASADASANGRARRVLSAASRDFALVGTETEIGEQVEKLKEAGVDLVVGYPARGLDSFLGQ